MTLTLIVLLCGGIAVVACAVSCVYAVISFRLARTAEQTAHLVRLNAILAARGPRRR